MRPNKQLVIQVPLRAEEYYSIRDSARARRTTAAAILRDMANLPHPPIGGPRSPGGGRPKSTSLTPKGR